MTDISTGNLDPGDNKDADRKDLPTTQVDDEEVASHRTTPDLPEGQGTGIGGEPTRLPADDDEDAMSATDES